MKQFKAGLGSGSAFILQPGSGSESAISMRIRIQEAKNRQFRTGNVKKFTNIVGLTMTNISRKLLFGL